MAFPDFHDCGDMPPGVYRARLEEVMETFGVGTSQREILAGRLIRIFQIAVETGHLSRFVVFGSFVTSKPEPNDVDVFMIMDDDFDVTGMEGDTALLFEHTSAQTCFGASVFWVRSMAALGGEEAAIADWMMTRRGHERGIVEITPPTNNDRRRN